MGINRDKPDRWKPDIAASVDLYNAWFMLFAPTTFRETRIRTAQWVEQALNPSRAVVANTYLNLYPKPHVAQRLAENPILLVQVWEALNHLDPADMLAEGRVYGGGLHKMEPKELAQVPVQALADLLGLTGQAALALAT